MRIGQFSKELKVSIDTVRHYMDMGLLVPIKDGGQYRFDEECYSDMETVLEMKALGFSLQEIRSFQFYKRISKLKPLQNEKFYNNLIKNKIKEINDEITTLNIISKKLDKKLNQIEENYLQPKRKIGIPLDTLHIFACPKCKSNLSLYSSEIIDNNIITGNLKCICGECLEIIDGVLMPSKQAPLFTSLKKEIDINLFFADYVKYTPAEYFEKLYSGFEWCKKQIDFESMKGKTVLDLGTGAGLFLRTIYDRIPDDTIYICVDYNNLMNKLLKETLEFDEVRKKIIFIGAEFHDIPIKEKSVDYVMDIAGTSNYMLNLREHLNENFLLHDLNYLYKNDSIIIGNYFIFDKFSQNHPVIPIQYRNRFTKKYLEDNLKETQFKITSTIRTDTLPLGGKYENFFVEGDNVYSLYLVGKREH